MHDLADIAQIKAPNFSSVVVVTDGWGLSVVRYGFGSVAYSISL